VTQEYEFRLHVQGPETAWIFPVPRGRSIIGRQAGIDLVLDDQHVSRRHAQLDCTATECHITDLASSNGTRVDGVALTANVPRPLGHAAVITIGAFELAVQRLPIEVSRAGEPPPQPGPSERARPGPIEEPEGADAVRLAAAPLPPPPPSPPVPPSAPEAGAESPVPPGLSIHSRHLMDYLPGAYHTDFMARFLGVFESILIPIEWTVDNFDLYLDPGTTPTGFLPWLAGWFEIALNPTWSEAQRRTLLAEAHRLYARRGTRWALARVLEIYTGFLPEIVDQGQDQEPFTFRVRLPVEAGALDRQSLERIVDANKPAHTTYTIVFDHGHK
jgi:phage tail-like protein